MVATPKSPPPPNTTGRWFIAILGLFLAVQFAVSFAPRLATWGLDYWSEVPLWLRVAALVIGVLALYPPLSERWAARLNGMETRRGWGYLGAGAALALFLICAEHGYSYGDGYSFRSFFPGGRLPEFKAQLSYMPLDMIVHWLVYRGIVLPLGGSINATYALLSAVGGVIGLAACVRIARTLFPDQRPARFLVVASACSGGMATLWFGHVEAYTLVGSCLLWSLAFLIEAPNRRSLLLAWCFAVLAVAFHLLAVAMLPALVLVSLPRRLLDRVQALPRSSRVILALVLFAFSGVGAFLVGLVKPDTLVPFTSNGNTTYTAFCAAHLIDMANLILFVAPIGLLGMLVAGGTGPGGGKDTDGAERRWMIGTLGLAASFLWLFGFWVDPLIGAFRDWDLIGAFGMPLSLWGGAVLADRFTKRRIAPNWLAVALFAVAHTGLWVYGVHDEAQALVRVDRLIRQDLHYSRSFHRGERLVPWAHLVTEVGGRRDLARDHLRNRAEWQPSDPNAWRNLGSLFWQLNQYDSSAFFFEQALKLRPADSLLLDQLGYVYVKLGRWEDARQAMSLLSLTYPLTATNLNLWAYSELQLMHLGHADSLLHQSILRKPEQQEAYYYLGSLAEARGDTAGALKNYEQATMGPTVDDAFHRCIRLYQAQLRWSDAARVSARWVKQFPNVAQSHFFLGIAYVGMQKYDSASVELKRADELNSGSALANYYLGLSYRHLGDTAQARERAIRATRIDSTFFLPYLELLYMAADAGDTAGAVAATHEYLRHVPGDSLNPYFKPFLK